MKTILLTIHFPTENADYEGVSVNFTFTGSITMEQLCHTVATVEDTIVENTEFFTLSLTSSESQIVIPIDSVPVVIEDDDGKHVNSMSSNGSQLLLCSRCCPPVHKGDVQCK